MKKIFVYGTLKVGGKFATFFDYYRKSAAQATACGNLYSIHDLFPAAIFNENNKRIIFGELQEFEEREFDNVLKRLDSIEGFNGGGNPDNLYNRVIIPVYIKDSSLPIFCYAYEYNRNLDDHTRIESGVWETQNK